ncbi:hypothetical protein [Photobacterium leiognathi]|uniref:hypothetical protein n=1 Tax=Photobacterium leiognathi TaxID=553611 RepID=UPI002980CF31|nr:hypothetical protein [Photobacterium leiognathi]
MGDYADFCEMYGGSAGDPDFMDKWIDEHVMPYEDTHDFEWYAENENKSHHELLMEQLESVDIMLELTIPEPAMFSFLVMVHAHIVSAIEGYLAGVFIHHVCNSDELTRKLVETDPEFGNRKFTLKEIYRENDALKVTVATYLKNLIFHDIKKIKIMYSTVLGHQFDDLSWLFKAVKVRHDCVHRAGYNKEGEKVDISVASIHAILQSVMELADEIENTINDL